jgi:hypothetical protein
MEACTQAKYASVGTMAFIIIVTPILLAFLSDLLSDFTLDTSISTGFVFFIVANSFLYELDPFWGGVIVISPYIAILSFFLWRFKVFRPLLKRAAVLKEKAKADGTPEDTENDGFMTLIFKIVPIGINVLKKGPVLVKGLKDMIQGMIDLVKNLAISSVILFIDTFTFMAQGFYFVFTLLLCGVLNLGNLHKCILFYLFDLFLLAIYMIIVSVLLLIDVFFNVKQYTGISCVEELNIIIDTIPVLDDIIYQMTTIHLLRYPDFIINLCYRCELMGDTKPFFDTAHKFNYDATQLVPTRIGRAISAVTGGIGDIVSIFSI